MYKIVFVFRLTTALMIEGRWSFIVIGIPSVYRTVVVRKNVPRTIIYFIEPSVCLGHALRLRGTGVLFPLPAYLLLGFTTRNTEQYLEYMKRVDELYLNNPTEESRLMEKERNPSFGLSGSTGFFLCECRIA